MTHICISIINYKTAAMTLTCVQSVLQDIEGRDAKIVIVDNASQDGSVEAISTWIAEHDATASVQLIVSVENTGFSGGHNQAIDACPADYYLLLNSDAVLKPGFFRELLTAAGNAPDAGLIAPQLQGEAGDVQDSCFRFPSPVSEFIRGACTGPITKVLKAYDTSLGQPPAASDIDWASFACILLNGRMVADIGCMDEGYFLYFEDTEYALRAKRAGWSLACAPQAVAVHFRGGSGDVKSRTAQYRRLPAYFYQSRNRFFRQRYGAAGPILANLMWTLGRGVAQLRWLAGRRPYPTVAAEARDIWTGTTHAVTVPAKR